MARQLLTIWNYLTRRPELVFALFLIAFVRLIPHPWNVTPIGATALFAGAYLSPRIAWMVALIPLAIGDLLIGGYHGTVMIFVYLGFVSTALAAYGWTGKRRSPARFAMAAGSGGVAFYLVSNFGVWAAGYYPATWQGLLECYVRGLPYLTNTLAGDLLYGTLFFAGFHALRLWADRPILRRPRLT